MGELHRLPWQDKAKIAQHGWQLVNVSQSCESIIEREVSLLWCINNQHLFQLLVGNLHTWVGKSGGVLYKIVNSSNKIATQITQGVYNTYQWWVCHVRSGGDTHYHPSSRQLCSLCMSQAYQVEIYTTIRGCCNTAAMPQSLPTKYHCTSCISNAVASVLRKL